MSQLFDDKATVFNWTTTNHATITLAARWQRIFPNGGDPPDNNGSIELNGNGATTTDGLTSITRTNVGWAMNDYTYENHIFGTASDSDYATYVTYNGDRNLVPKDTDTYSDDEYCYSLVGWSVDKNARHTEVGNYVYTPYTTQRIMDMLYDYGGYKDSGEKNTEWSIARVNKIAKTIKTYRDNWICDANKRNVTLYAIWDAYPQITADDVYILDTFLDEATDEELEEKLMSSAKVTDLEDDDAAKKANPKNPEEIKAVLVDDISVLRQEMQQLGAGGKVTYTIKATDSAGHETTHVVTVHVCETQAIDNHAVVRYIDEENYNKDSEEDGALVENSVWYVNESYRNEITKAFQSLANNTYCQSYFFDVNAIDATQEYIKTKGRANYENEDALATYTNTFLKDATQVATHNKTKVTNLSYLKSAATCTNEAEYYYVCEDCGAVLNETYTVGDKLEHQYKNKTIAPTCEEQGYTLQTCKVCGYQQKINYKDALGHDYVLVDSLEPTCEDKGYELYVCDRCDKEDKREIAATGHDYELVEQAATCTEDGYSYHICKTCDKILETDIVVPATGHTWVNVVNDMYLYNEPTCTDNAVYYQSCKDCGMTKYDYCVANQLDASDVTFEAENSTIAHTWAEIPKDDFVSEKSECGKATVYKISCSECGITKEDYYKNTGTSTKGVTFTFKDEDNIYQHDFTGVDTDNTDYLKTEAVCETPAIYYYYCTHCGKPATVANNNGDELTFEYGKYLGHEYKDGYCIRCEKEEVPGFYDEDGILLCKWDDITVDVTTNYTEDTKTEDLENTISNRLKGTYINDEGEEISLSLTKTIVVPDTITTIGSYAFAGCTASVVKLPKYITSIGDNAFYMAYAMTSIDLPKTVTSIGDKAFYGCQSLTAINIENSSVSIGQEAFDDCDIVNFSDGKTMKHDFSRKKTYVQDDESLENDPYEIYKVSDVTCMAPAVYKYACQYCSEAGEETYEYGIALGYEEHDFVDTIKSEPTCESAEIRYIKCSRCGVIQEGSEYVNYDNPATGHICTKEIDYYNSSYSIYGYCDSCGIAMKNATEAGKNEHVWSKVDETDYTETGDDALYSYDCMTKTTDANGKETYEYAYCDTVKTYTCSDCDIKKTEYWATGKYKKHDEKYCDESKHLLKTVYSEWAMK
jgi:hypothetical protein